MFCIKCGKQMPDDAMFCAACGAPLMQPKPTETPKQEPLVEITQESPSSTPEDSFVNSTPATNDTQNPQAKSKKKMKIVLLLSLCALAFLLILAAVALTVYWIFSQNRQQTEPVWAYVDKGGTAYLCYGDGEKISINGVEDAFMTPDQKKVVVLEKGGDLYWTDVKLSEKHVILERSKDMEIELDDGWLYNDSFFYFAESPYRKNGSEVMDEILYRYSFDDGANIEVYVESKDNVDDLQITEGYSYAKCASVAIARDGWIEVLNADSDEFKKLTKYDKGKDIELMAISPDGKTLIWAVEVDTTYTVYYSYDDVVTKIKSSVEQFDEAAISADNELAFVFVDQDLVYIRGEEYNTVHFSDELYYCFTEDGRPFYVDNDTHKDLGCFVEIMGEKDCTLYYVEFATATKHKLLTAEIILTASNEKIVYKTSGGRYMYAEFDPDKVLLDEGHTITSADKVRFFNLTECSDYIFYYVYDKDYDQSMADLYYYDIDENQSKKITSEVLSYLEISTDGKKIFYFEDINKEEATGTLMIYDVKKETEKQIATDVAIYSVTSYFLNGTVDPDSFFYSTKSDDDEYDIYYYDGKKSNVIVSDFEQ